MNGSATLDTLPHRRCVVEKAAGRISSATALNKFCSILTSNGVYTEFGIDPAMTATTQIVAGLCRIFVVSFRAYFSSRIVSYAPAPLPCRASFPSSCRRRTLNGIVSTRFLGLTGLFCCCTLFIRYHVILHRAKSHNTAAAYNKHRVRCGTGRGVPNRFLIAGSFYSFMIRGVSK